jgi:oligopeptide transport system substrate-binding protein
VGRARRLLEVAGYPGGVNFPRIRLLVNRNEQQRLVALAVARMWREALGVETEIVVRPWEEYEAMLRAGDYDVARRSLVMQTTDEETNMLELFGDAVQAEPSGTPAAGGAVEASPGPAAPQTGAPAVAARAETVAAPLILTEAQALRELPAIPLHFSSSYALVKPYVEGFESNLLDAPSLKHVRINMGWLAPPEQSARVERRPRP